MKARNYIDVEQVSGGVLPVIAADIGGTYLYDTMGGREGINEYFANG